MSKKINRREFISRGAASLAGLTLAGSAIGSVVGFAPDADSRSDAQRVPKRMMVDRVPLGATGLVVSRMAMGTGTVGGGGASNQTRLGPQAFNEMFRHGYDRGARFYDTAEGYGSIPFVGEAIKGLPRKNITLLTKMYTQADGSEDLPDVRAKIEEFLRQFGTDYMDVLLLHCMTSGDWNETRTHYMEAFSRAKEAGLVRAVGISCHDLDAMRTAATEPWVDVIMARINPFGSIMDGSPDQVKEVLHLARDNGKGVVGMKIFGEGRHVTDPERERSIDYAIHQSGVHAMTLGLQSVAQLDDAIDRVIRLSKRA